MTINNKSERNYRGKCLGWPVTSYGAEVWRITISAMTLVCAFRTFLDKMKLNDNDSMEK